MRGYLINAILITRDQLTVGQLSYILLHNRHAQLFMFSTHKSYRKCIPYTTDFYTCYTMAALCALLLTIGA